MTARQLLGLVLVAIGKRVALCGMRLADVAVIVMVRKDRTIRINEAAVYPVAWTSAHEQQPVNTVPPRESN